MTRMLKFMLTAALVVACGLAEAASSYFDEAIEAIQDWDYATAAERLRAAAEQNDPRAQEMLGFMLLWGEQLYGGAVRRDPAAGFQWLTRAAANGREGAAYFLRRKAERQAARQATTDALDAATPR